MLLCPWVQYVWFGSNVGYCPNGQAITTFDQWLQTMDQRQYATSSHKTCLLVQIGVICWEIWKERSHACFNHTSPNPISVITKSKLLFGDISARVSFLRHASSFESPQPSLNWPAPASRFYKVNVDGAWTTSFLRDSMGSMVGGEAKFLLRSTVEEIEAEAVLARMLLAREHQLQEIIIESDSKSVFNVIINRHYKGSWRIFPIIAAIRRLATHFSNIRCTWTSRSSNQAAHFAAKLTNLRVSTCRWRQRPLPLC